MVGEIPFPDLQALKHAPMIGDDFFRSVDKIFDTTKNGQAPSFATECRIPLRVHLKYKTPNQSLEFRTLNMQCT